MRRYAHLCLGLLCLSLTMAMPILALRAQTAQAPPPQRLGGSHVHSDGCVHTTPESHDLSSVRWTGEATKSCRHLSNGQVIEYRIPSFLEAIALSTPGHATLYARSGKPILSVCFAPGTPQEVVDMHLQRMQNLQQGAWPNPWSDYQTHSQWGSLGSPTHLTWSFVPDGVSIMGYFGEPTSNSALFADLDTEFGINGGRAIWINRFAQSFQRWDEISGISFSRVTAPGFDWDDGANFDTASGSEFRGDIRIGGHPIDGLNNVLAYNFYPASGAGGNMVLDTGDIWNSPLSAHLYLRNLVMHEIGHGLGMAHVCPHVGTKLMEPFLTTFFDGPQHDEIRHAHRLYGDAFESNDSVAQATDLGTIAIPSLLNNFEDVPATLSGTNPANASRLSIDAAGDVDFYRFFLPAGGVIQITLSPIGLSYGDNPQNSGCTQTSTTHSMFQANLGFEILAANGTTVLATGNSAGMGLPETVLLSLASGGTYYMRVFANGAVSQSQLYGFDLATASSLNQQPTVSSLSPPSVIVGSPSFSLTVTGTNFVPGTTVRWNSSNRTTTYVNPTTIVATILTNDVVTTGNYLITVASPPPGGGTSNPFNFLVLNPVPTINSISPSSGLAGGPTFTLTVTGTGFVSSTSVRWNNSSIATNVISSTHLTATVGSSQLTQAGTVQVAVSNPTPGGGLSSSLPFTLSYAVPTISGTSPANQTVGSFGGTVQVIGTGFTPASEVRWNGVLRTSSYTGPTTITVPTQAQDYLQAGNVTITVTNPTPGGGTSNTHLFPVLFATPTINSISPTSTTAGSPSLSLVVNGGGFYPQSIIRWNGQNRPTTFVNSSRLETVIHATEIAAPGTAEVTVFNPTPGGGTSLPRTFTMNNAVPVLIGLSPNSVFAGGPSFVLTCTGTGFNSNSIVRLNGQDRATTFVSGTQITATIPASDLSTVGTRTISIFNLSSGGGASGNLILNVNPRTFSGTVDLQAWVGDPTTVPITFKIRPAGGAPGSELASITMNLSPASGFMFTAPIPPGTYDLYADGSIWLQRRLSNITITSGAISDLVFPLLTGDIDGDEEITNADYSIWAVNNGSMVTPGTQGDLDGDGEVTNNDYSLWAVNNGTLGDP
ncbi:MAG TPA: matrixin family metalloprotease [Fimbriimonadaceae bacterium]|nr:matrixin family metalloprotease [Fimbriimonadaceae bacterium]